MSTSVSICVGIAAYNSENTIEAAINSVLNQSFQEFSIIIVDDCSTDKTPTIIENKFSNDPRITFIRNKNNIGIGLTREKIRQLASADYLTWLDADDEFLHNRLEKLLAAAQSEGADLTIDSYYHFNNDGPISIIKIGRAHV